MVPFCVFLLSAIVRATPADVLSAMRRANGGSAWAAVASLTIDGRASGFGLSGRYREIDDVRSGRFARRGRYGRYGYAEGSNASGRWRDDFSQAVHVLNSPAARAEDVTERYLVRRGYLALADTSGRRFAPSSTRADSAFYRIEVSPAGGEPATLYVRRSTLRLERIRFQRAERVEEVRLGDYRAVDGLCVPFRIAVDDGDELGSGVVAVDAYRVSRHVDANALRTPASSNDVTFATGARRTALVARVEPSGFLIVSASIDGRGPYPFILDTGGHDIVTPRLARALQLHVGGAAVSYGAGSGSTPTRLTDVAEVRMGGARMMRQPFTVLDLDLGSVERGGRTVPVAGILGLEVFERFAVTIDLGARTVVLDASRHPMRRGPRTVPIAFTSDQPLVRASLDGNPGTFAIDTGNNVGLIVFARWLRDHARTASLRGGAAFGGTTVGGSAGMRRAVANRFALGDRAIANVPLGIADMHAGSLSSPSEAGNIGLAVLARFRRVTFDYRSGTVAFEGRR